MSRTLGMMEREMSKNERGSRTSMGKGIPPLRYAFHNEAYLYFLSLEEVSFV